MGTVFAFSRGAFFKSSESFASSSSESSFRFLLFVPTIAEKLNYFIWSLGERMDFSLADIPRGHRLLSFLLPLKCMQCVHRGQKTSYIGMQ